MDVDELRAHWNEILNALEINNRMAWIAYFDARLAKIDTNTVFLDFSDVTKFPGSLDYFEIRGAHREALEQSILEITGLSLCVEEIR